MVSANMTDTNTTKTGWMEPRKFAMLLGMASMLMFFAGLTSAMLVKKADIATWEYFKLPNIFALSTLVLLASSVPVQLMIKAYKTTSWFNYRLWMGMTLLLAIVFTAMQYVGWQHINAIGMPLDGGNPSGGFVYVISGAHAAHVLGGVVILLIMFIRAVRRRKDPSFALIHTENPRRLVNHQLIGMYWHFVDVLWLYLFIFFYVNY